MKRIDILEEAAHNGTKYSAIGVNPTFGQAYFYSKEAGNRLLNFADVIWEKDIDEIIANCRKFGITDFTISSSFSGLLATIAAFEAKGCHIVRMVEVNATYYAFTGNIHEEPRKAILPALLMRLDKE